MKQFLLFLSILCLSFACKKVKTMDENFNTNNIDFKIDSLFADIIAVNFTGTNNNYTAAVTIESPDIDCDQYANWWEIYNSEGDLIYRRILGHSHANEQPFTRSGGPISISEDDAIYIRGYMHPTGYGGKVFFGTIECGFIQEEMVEIDFPELATEEPLPTDCLY